MSNVKKLRAIYDIITDGEICAEEMVGRIGEIVTERPGLTDLQKEQYAGKPTNTEEIHSAVMSGLAEENINYDSDGETYWVDLANGDTYYISVNKCEG